MPEAPIPSKTLPTIPPHEAGRKIRRLAKSLYNAAKTNPMATGAVKYTPSYNVFDPTSNFRIADYDHAIQTAVARVEEAAKARKTSDVVSALEYLEMNHRDRDNYMLKYLRGAERVIERARDWHLSYPPSNSYPYVYDDSYGENRSFTDVLEEISELTQAFPTQPGMPSPDSKETVIRAIVAILRTHKIPGSETLAQYPTEEVNDGTETAGGAADEAPAEEGAVQDLNHDLSSALVTSDISSSSTGGTVSLGGDSPF